MNFSRLLGPHLPSESLSIAGANGQPEFHYSQLATWKLQLVSMMKCTSPCRQNRHDPLNLLWNQSYNGEPWQWTTGVPLNTQPGKTRTRLQRHLALACLEIRSRNEEAINSTRNIIYSPKVFYFLLYRRRYFLFVSELI